MWFCHKNRYKDQWNIIASVEIIPNIYGQLTFGWIKQWKFSGTKYSFFNKTVGKTRLQIKNDEFRTPPHSIKIDINWIICKILNNKNFRRNIVMNFLTLVWWLILSVNLIGPQCPNLYLNIVLDVSVKVILA